MQQQKETKQKQKQNRHGRKTVGPFLRVLIEADTNFTN